MNDKTADLIVVGGGGSGMAGAIEAARSGARVILFEKGARLGGTTGWSVGSYTTSASPHQKRKGIVDTPAAHFADMDQVNAAATRSGHTDNLALRKLLTDHAPETLQWLMDLGIVFLGPNPEPPHSAWRMHNVIPSSKAFVHFLQRECERLGVALLTNHQVLDLRVEDGRVRGVVVRDADGNTQHYSASRGVVLAAGDFAASHELRQRYFAEEVVKAEPVNPLSTGDGIRMAELHGATIINGAHANSPRMRFVPAAPTWFHRVPPYRLFTKTLSFLWNWIPLFLLRPFMMRFLTTALGPEPTLFKAGALLVAPSGKLVPVDLGSLALHLARQPENSACILFDATVAAKLNEWPNFISTAPGIAYAYLSDYRKARRDIYFEADTLSDLCRKIGVDGSVLAEDVARERTARAAKGDSVSLLERGPFYALGPVRAYVTMTEGGLRVDEQLRVLGQGGQPIAGLYAAGSNGQGGLLIEGHGHHIAWAFVSGRIAARNAVRTP